MRNAAAQAIERGEMLEFRPERELGAEPRFEVVEGGGLDVRARTGVSSEFLARVQMVVMAAVAFFVLGTLRVALTSATVAQLSANAQARSQIEAFETSNNNLRVERSLLGSAARIDRIATQNYGMVAASSYDLIVIESEAAPEEAVEDDAAPEGGGIGDAVEDKSALGGSGFLFEATQLAAGL